MSLKSRPDVASFATIATSLQTRDPKDAVRLTEGTWKSLYATKDMRADMVPSDAEVVETSGDGNYAPRRERSHGIVVVLCTRAIFHSLTKTTHDINKTMLIGNVDRSH